MIIKEETINDDPSLVLREEEKTLKEKRKEFIENMNYALSHFNWGDSALDAKAIDILNTWKNILIENEEKAVKRLKEGLQYTAYVDERLKLVDKIFGEEK